MASSGLPRNPAELAEHADDFIAALGTPGGLAASGLDAAQLTALGNAMTALRDRVDDRAAAKAAYDAAVEAVEGQHETAEALYRGLRNQAGNHVNMTDVLRAQARLTIRDTEPTPSGAPPEITDLVVKAHASGTNFLDWSVPSGRGLRYEVFTSAAAGGPWTLIGSATTSSFAHHEAGAGVTRHYRVVAKRGTLEGLPSNEASVYV